MKRHVFTVLSALSLLLFVAAAALWVRSYWASDTLYILRWDDDDHLTFFTQDVYVAGRGGIGFSRMVESGDRATFRNELESGRKARGWAIHSPQWRRGEPKYPRFHLLSTDDPNRRFHWRRWAKGEFKGRPGTQYWYDLIVPLWCLALPSSLAPLLWTVRWSRTRRRIRRGLCPSCGYDLRETPDRCPECGHVPLTARTEVPA